MQATKTERKYKRPWLYPKQERAIFDPARISVVEASTKSGKTVGCIAWLVEQALIGGRPGRNYWWVAPIYAQAAIAFRRMKRALPQGQFTANESDTYITLDNGTVIWFKSADKPDSLFGEDVYACVIDEATRCKEEAWHAIRTTLTATRGPVRIIGNVKGRRNWAYKLARQAESGAESMAYHKMIAADAIAAGILQEAEVELARQQLPEDVFNELYLAQPSEEGGNPFGMAAIREALAPLSVNQAVCYGIDVAEKVDWTVAVGLDRDGVVCRFERWQSPWEETIARIRGLVYGVPALVDATGVGDPVLKWLSADRGGNFMGFVFTETSRIDLLKNLAVMIQKKQLRFPDGPIRGELEAFEYVMTSSGKVKWEVSEGLHDDCVMALALAARHYNTIATTLQTPRVRINQQAKWAWKAI